MAKSAAAAAVILSSVVVMWLAATSAESAIPCNSVMNSLSSCISFAQGSGTVPGACCSGLKWVNSVSKTTPDVQNVCWCFKKMLPDLGAKPAWVNTIPEKCGVNFSYKYSPSVDCSKVSR